MIYSIRQSIAYIANERIDTRYDLWVFERNKTEEQENKTTKKMHAAIDLHINKFRTSRTIAAIVVAMVAALLLLLLCSFFYMLNSDFRQDKDNSFKSNVNTSTHRVLCHAFLKVNIPRNKYKIVTNEEKHTRYNCFRCWINVYVWVWVYG